MKIRNRAAIQVSLLALASPAFAQLPPEDALKSFQIADGLRIELVAAEPLVASPCAMAFDERGRLFVAENRGYPNTSTPPQGTIAMLEDTDGDGRMDKRTVFADGLTFPNGVLPWRGGLIVTCAPDVLYFKDTDGDGRADERRVLLSGFDTKGSTQLRVNAPTLGPDGWIYLAAGLSGGAITCPEHPERPALKMTADVRFHPDTLEVENVDGRSQYGMSFDDYGNRFICMNRVPVQHVVLSSKVLTRNPHLAFSETVQDCSERSVKSGLRGGGDGVRLFPISQNLTTADSHAGTFSAACEIMIWRGGALPEKYVGCAFTCDPTGNLVHVDKLEPRGATFTAVAMFEKEQREFLASRDDWFRPVFLATGPDGALYIADMYRKTIEHPDYLPEEIRKRTDFESGKGMGRIWRIWRKSGATQKPVKSLAGLSKSELQTAIALGDDRSADATKELAAIAVQYRSDRWMRAAVLSGIAGRHEPFLGHYVAALKDVDAAAEEVLIDVARCFANIAELKKALPDAAPAFGRSGLPMTLIALLLGTVESSGERLAPASDDVWLNAIFTTAAERARDEDLDLASRAHAVRLLGHAPWAKAYAALAALASRERNANLRTVAIRALCQFDEPSIAQELLTPERWRDATPEIRDGTLAALLARPQHLAGVLAAFEGGAIPASALNGQQRERFLKHPDPMIQERAEKLFGTAMVGDRQKAFEDAKAALALAVNGSHGREVFKTHCASCHRLEREGFAVGPDLLDIRNQPKESILFHIVVPDAEVAPAFAPYLIETKDGRTLSGVLASETPTSVMLRMPLALEETLLRSNVAKLEALPGSLMPPGLEAAMSRQDLADLLAFLKGEK
jgi:putative membrane-bound dehydrogenase-like protein